MKPLTATERKRTPSARAKQWCREAQEQGRILAWDWCESFNSFTKRKKDLFGFADLVMVRAGSRPSSMMDTPPGLVAVQVTGGGNGPARVAKIKAEPAAAAWLRAGAKIQVWDYRQRKVRGVGVVSIERVVIQVGE